MINKKTPIEEAVEMAKIYGNHRYEEGREQGWRDVETHVKNTGECPIVAYYCPKRNQCDDCEELIALRGELVEKTDRLSKIIMWLLKRYYESLEKTFEEELKQVDEILKPVRLMDLIYTEQCKTMSKPLYEYGFGDAESEE